MDQIKHYNKVIYYAHEGRGLRIGLVWLKVNSNTLYGWYAGYEGGGCHMDCWFKAIFDTEGNITNLYNFTGDPCEEDPWDNCLITGTSTEENPIFTPQEYEICDKARDELLPEFIVFDDDLEQFILTEEKLEELEDDDECYLLIDIENNEQRAMLNQIQQNWSLMAEVNLEI